MSDTVNPYQLGPETNEGSVADPMVSSAAGLIATTGAVSHYSIHDEDCQFDWA